MRNVPAGERIAVLETKIDKLTELMTKHIEQYDKREKFVNRCLIIFFVMILLSALGNTSAIAALLSKLVSSI